MLRQTSKLKVASAMHVPLTLSTLLEICMTALTPTATNHWFVGDLARVTGQLVQRAFEYLLYTCTTAGTARLRALTRTCVALSTFCVSSGFPELAESCWTRLVLFRVESGPDSNWDKLDVSLAASARISRMTPRNRADFYAIARALGAEDWGEEGDSLRVSRGYKYDYLAGAHQ